MHLPLLLLIGEVLGVGNFIHVVADLDKTIAFYHETLGLELARPAGTFSENALVNGLYDAAGSQSRVAVFRVPDSPLGLEFVEFKGIAQKAVRLGAQDPGTSILFLKVAGAVPEGLIQDPDGFYISRSQTQATSLSLVVGDKQRALQLYTEIPGFEVHLLESKGAAGKRPAIHDPGAGVLRLRVKDVAALSARLTAEGLTTVGKAGNFTIFRDPDGFYFQLTPWTPATPGR